MPRKRRSNLHRLPTSLLLALAAISLAFVYCPVAVAAADKKAEKKPLEWVADLKSPVQGTRTRATVALARLEPTPPEVVQATADLLNDENWPVRAQVLMVLGNMGADASTRLPQIMAALEDQNEHVRRSAASAITRVPAATRETLLALVRALESDDRYLRSERWARQFAQNDDENMRIVSLYLAASLGDPQALQPIATLLQEQPGHSARYALLLGLADLTTPAEFEKLTADQPKDNEYESVLRLASLRVAQVEERVSLARQMLNSDFPNERRIAMDALLKADAVSELSPLLKQWGRVPPKARATIAAGLYRGGYQIVEKDRSLEIERVPPGNPEASAW